MVDPKDTSKLGGCYGRQKHQVLSLQYLLKMMMVTEAQRQCSFVIVGELSQTLQLVGLVLISQHPLLPCSQPTIKPF